MKGMPGNIYEQLLETFKSITSEIELDKLVQQITDIGTQVTGAQFGAFFYDVVSDTGQKYVLYSISGVPKEAFSKFPTPRNTAVFHPTFSGLGTVRYDDVTSESHYGKSAPHFGMPKGHLPSKELPRNIGDIANYQRSNWWIVFWPFGSSKIQQTA